MPNKKAIAKRQKRLKHNGAKLSEYDKPRLNAKTTYFYYEMQGTIRANKQRVKHVKPYDIEQQRKRQAKKLLHEWIQPQSYRKTNPYQEKTLYDQCKKKV